MGLSSDLVVSAHSGASALDNGHKQIFETVPRSTGDLPPLYVYSHGCRQPLWARSMAKFGQGVSGCHHIRFSRAGTEQLDLAGAVQNKLKVNGFEFGRN